MNQVSRLNKGGYRIGNSDLFNVQVLIKNSVIPFCLATRWLDFRILKTHKAVAR